MRHLQRRESLQALDRPTSDQFAFVRDHERPAFDSFIAIWRNEDSHIVIGAPTIPRLAKAWKRITGLELIRDNVQHVRMIQAR